jgi:hypothetical protein
MKNRSNKVTAKQVELAREVIIDPVLFARRVLGVRLSESQAEILQSIRTHRKTAIKACHGVGKTFVLAVATLWWLARYKDGIVLTTSATFRQVKTQIWSELRRLVVNAKIPYPDLNMTELKLRGDDNFALGLSTNQAENFQGYHGKHVLIIADEAPGIEAEIWDAMAGVAAGGDVRIVMAGNPTTPSGPFYDAFHRERASWNCISINAFDSPNLEGVSLEQLLQFDPSEGGPLDQNPFRHFVTKRWVYEQYFAWWHGDEQSSPAWMSRVRGEFPDQAEDTLIKLRWLERAKERALRDPVEDSGRRLVAGVDVGGGQAETVVIVCETKGRTHRIITMGAWRAEDTRGSVVRFLAPYRSRLTIVRVDGTSIGHNFGLHLRDQGFHVDLVKVGLPCRSRPNLREDDPSKRFANEKARLYQNLADAFERDEIDGLSDETTIGQLADLRYEIDSRGRMRIESKQKARSRRRASPDRAEALMLAIGERRERTLWDRDLAGIYHKEGRRKEAIADELGATDEEVDRWISEDVQREAARNRYQFEPRCAGCHETIDINAVRTSMMGKEYHEKCGRMAIFGPYAA